MPFYEYQCEACGKHHEVLQKMSDAPLKKCPACGKPRLKRLISAPVFRLKGGGWYETDFKTDKDAKRNLHGEEAKSDRLTEAKPAAPAAPAAEAAPAAKAEPKESSKSAAKSTAKAGPKTAARKAAKTAKKAAKRR